MTTYIKNAPSISILLVAYFLTYPINASAQGAESEISPAYSFNREYGRGWDCIRGYVKSSNQCVPVTVPDNAYLDACGSSWKCHRGYIKSRSSCREVIVPPNAYLIEAQYGQGWACERGY